MMVGQAAKAYQQPSLWFAVPEPTSTTAKRWLDNNNSIYVELVIMPRRPSPQTLTVLAALLVNPSDWRYGYDLSQQTSLKSGTLYPILLRLAEWGWLEHDWEHPEGEKPRHVYRLTKDGKKLARLALQPGRGSLGKILEA